MPSLLPRLGQAQAGGQAPPEHPTVRSGSSRDRLLRGAGMLSTVPWGRAGQCRSSQSPVPPYLRETQGRPGNGSGDQPRVPVAGAEAKPGRVRFGGGNSVSCSPATATVTRQGQASESRSGSRAAGACPGVGTAEAGHPAELPAAPPQGHQQKGDSPLRAVPESRHQILALAGGTRARALAPLSEGQPYSSQAWHQQHFL